MTVSAVRSRSRSVGSYREAMRQFAGMRNLDIWYTRIDVEETLAPLLKQMSAKAQKRAEKNLAKIAGKGQHPGVRQARRHGRR